MMSGPAPVLAATAAFGRTSSHPSLSTRTSMLYLSWNFWTFFMYWSMSPCTNRLHRSTRSFAPFSGVPVHCCACALFVQISGPAAAPAASPADVFRNLRRLISLTTFSSFEDANNDLSMLLGDEPHPARRVEQMGARQVRHQPDLVAGATADAVADERRQLLAVEATEELRVGAGRLDDDHFGRQSRIRRNDAVLGPHAVEHRLAVGRSCVRGKRQPDAAFEFDTRRRAVHARHAGYKIHRRRADEGSYERVDGRVVQLQRIADLLDDAVAHHNDPVGHRHRFDLIVRHVDRRRLQALVQLLDLGTHLYAKLRIEVRQRLVEQEYLRVADDRAAHRHALPLPARQLAWIAIKVRRESEYLGGARDARADVVGAALREFQRERH